jgi:very-short-patch-repair endonuclease
VAYEAWQKEEWSSAGFRIIPEGHADLTPIDGTVQAVTPPPDQSELVAAILHVVEKMSGPVDLVPEQDGIRFKGADGTTGVLLRGLGHVLVDKAAGPTYVGTLCPNFPIKKSLGFVHKFIDPAHDAFDCKVESETTTVITASDTCVTVYSAKPNDYANVRVGRSEGRVGGKKVIQLKQVIDGAAMSAMRSTFNEDTRRILQGNISFVNNGTALIVNNVVRLDPDANRHDDEELFQAVFAADPLLKDRARYEPDVKAKDCNGLYFCNPETNVWRREHNSVFERLMIATFDKLPLTRADKRHIHSRRGRNDMAYLLGSQVLENDFAKRLDTNRDLFVVDNGVFDMAKDGAFRPIAVEDMISMTAGWAYDADMAKTHRGDVEKFLADVLPVAEERLAVTVFFARLLSGHRAEKKFLVLTDTTGGNNGKTALSKMFVKFFGVHRFAAHNSATTTFLCKGSIARDSNSHNAGMQAYRRTRLLVAEELTCSMRLDEGLIKRLTGGLEVDVGGRACNGGGEADELFVYDWQAGIVLIFNEGDCPQFDASDSAFIGRMIYATFRALFVKSSVHSQLDPEEEPFVHVSDKFVVHRFSAWRSALLDILRDVYRANEACENPTPLSFDEGRQSIAGRGNTVAEWLDDHVDVTGATGDTLLLARLGDLYAVGKAKKSVPDDFALLVKAYMSTKPGVLFRDKTSIKDGEGGYLSVRDLFRGVRLASDLDMATRAHQRGLNERINLRDHYFLKNDDTSSLSERTFRDAFELASGIVFEHNIRPVWLKNPVTFHTMELDMFCAKLKLAIEYDGRHHYVYPNQYHKDMDEFRAQQARDVAKDELCLQKGVTLIRVRGCEKGVAEEVRWCMDQIKISRGIDLIANATNA